MLDVYAKGYNLYIKAVKRLYNTWKGHYTVVEFAALAKTTSK